jgi:oligoribonuclease (3'-5' exoribonuclease)
MLLVLDLETDGLDPSENIILEVGAILLDAQDNVRTSWQFLCPHRGLDNVHPVVVEMHTKNGLWRDCMQWGRDMEEVDVLLSTGLRSYGALASQVVLVGHSIHFDLSFIRAQMPKTAGLLSHRIRDIGAMARTLRDWGVGFPELPGMPHRALEDAKIEHAGYLDLKRQVQRMDHAYCLAVDEGVTLHPA